MSSRYFDCGLRDIPRDKLGLAVIPAPAGIQGFWIPTPIFMGAGFRGYDIEISGPVLADPVAVAFLEQFLAQADVFRRDLDQLVLVDELQSLF